jgi:hypothetical protein
MIAEQTVVAPSAATLAYVADGRVYVESVVTGERTDLDEGAEVRPLYFTTDGATLILADQAVADETHLVRLDLDTGARTDLGPAVGSASSGGGMSHFSPNEAEIVGAAFDTVRAVRLDGGGDRLVWSGTDELTAARSAAFTGAGDVVYVIEENLTPGSDTPDVLDHLWIERGGVSAPLLEDRQHCNGPTASASGALIAWPCDDGTHVFSAADGVEVLSLPVRGDVLGFDAADRGLVLRAWSTDDEILWVASSGEQEVIAVPAGSDAWEIDYRP